jgi:iron complex outermembrane receptor protein
MNYPRSFILDFVGRIAAALAVAGAFAPPALAAANATLDEVVVTAKRIEVEAEVERPLVPGGVTMVDGQDLYARSVTNLADMLRYAPGVWSESASGSDELFFSSRGSNLDATDYDKNGIKLLQDGLPVTTADGNNHNRIIDPLSARYAVVARGANALTYGASTLGGAIDFLSPNARTTSPYSVFVNGGSHGLFTGRASAGTVAGPFDAFATLEAKSWEGYRDHSSQDRVGFYANAGWQSSSNLSTRIYATYLHNEEQLPGALTQAKVAADPDQANSSALTGNFQKNVETVRVAANTTWQIDERNSLQAGLSYEAQSLYHPIVDVRIDFDGPAGNPPVQVFSLLVDTDHRDFGAMMRFHAEIGAHDLVAGLNYGDGSVKGGNYGNDGGYRDGLNERVDNHADSLELFLMDRWQFASTWTLAYGAQWVDAGRDVRTSDVATGTVSNPKDDYTSFNPRAGVIYALTDASELFASVSRLFEAPTTFEMQDDVRGGDATLEPMEGTVYEVGLRASSEFGLGSTWRWDISAYYAQIRDAILSVDDPEAPGNSLTTNIDRTIHAGVEALLGASLSLGDGGAHRIEPLVSATWNKFSFDSDATYGDNDLPAAPEYAVRGEVLFRHSAGFYVGPTFDFIGARYADFANTYLVDSYQLLGLRAGYTAGHWEVFADLRNLLDEDYIATVGVLNAARPESEILYPGAPFSAYIGVRVEF